MVIGKIAPFNPEQDDFEAWVEIVDGYFIANDIDKAKTPTKAVAVLISSVGLQTYTLLKSLISPKDPSAESYQALVDVLTKHFKPAPKSLAERHKFYSRKQMPGEKVNGFLAELRKLAITCKFGDLNMSLRDQFIFGLTSEEIQRKIFLENDDVKLDKVVSLAVCQEQAETSTQVVRGGPITQQSVVDSVNKVGYGKSNEKYRSGSSQASYGNNEKHRSGSSSSKSSCPNCGRAHLKKDCPHKDVECHNCQKLGHFARFCHSGRKFDTDESVHSVKSVRKSNPPIMLKVNVLDIDLDMELDTGSDSTFFSFADWQKVGKPHLQKSNSFTTFTNEPFVSKGHFVAKVEHNKQIQSVKIEVCNNSSLLGRDFLNVFQVDWIHVKSQCGQVFQVQVVSDAQELLTEFGDVFDKPVGRIQGFKAKLVLKEDAVPKFCKSRPVPFAIREKVDAELDKMEKTGAIERIEHSDWASPLVVVPKPNGKVRITGDFKRTVNNQLCVTQYPLSRVDDLLETVSCGLEFSRLDATDHQVEVDEASKKFLVINTHRGLYRYNVLPQGIASSPAIFQELMDKMLHGIPNCGAFVDDVIASGSTTKSHLGNIRQILMRMREFNFRLSRDKSEFLKLTVQFLGLTISRDGIRTHPKNVEPIVRLKKLDNAAEVKSFLGLVNFYAKFIKHMSTLCEPLNNLTREGVEFNWTAECNRAFEEIKKQVSSAPILAHFQQSLPLGISCDASNVGLGVVLFHKYPDGSERPISFASKTLSSSERNYSQIEKEGLSIVFGVKKFFQFLYGRRFTLVTDHQPLLQIFGEKCALPPLVASRLHRWALFLSTFQFEVVYRNTKNHGNADALSRLPLPESAPIDEVSEQVVKRIQEANPVTSQLVKNRTSRDLVLGKVIRFVHNGWPTKQCEVPQELHPYFGHRLEFTVEDGILMWGVRVVVPAALQSPVLQQLHETHPGIVRMKSLARQHVWWPGVDRDIESTVKSCLECCTHQDNPAVAQLHPWSYPVRPWQRLHIDLAGPFLNNMWLIVVDAHSKWPEVFNLGQNTTSGRVVSCLRETFSRFGIPETIVSDNGPQFISQEFEEFCTKNGIRHTTSSAYHPRSNGEAERFVKTFKGSMGKEKGNVNLSLCSFLLTYSVTPHATTGVSPSEIMMKSKPKTRLDLIKPNPSVRVRQQQQLAVERSPFSAIRRFGPGDQVWVQSHSKDAPKWSLGTIVRPVGPVSYDVQVGDRRMKRHVDQILGATVSPFPSSSEKLQLSSPEAEDQTPPATIPEYTSPDGSPVLSGTTTIETSPVLQADESVTASSRPVRQRTQPQRLTYDKF